MFLTYLDLNFIFSLIEDGAIAVRMTVDPNSGNIYYTAVIMDVTDYGYIGLYRLDSGQSVLIPGLTRPRDIVISPDDG